MREGRELRDTRDDESSIVVSAALARRMFATASPLGRKLYFDFGSGERGFTIVGIAADTKHMSLGEEEALTMYHSLADMRNWRTQVDFMIRPRTTTAEASKALRTALLDLNGSSAVETRRLADSMGLALLPSQAGGIVFGFLGLLGLMLSAVGLHGTVAFSVRQRSSEIGLRMALGATPSQVLGMIVRENAVTLLWGGAVGMALAFAIAKPLAIVLVPGLQAAEPSSVASILMGIALVALIAILGPARRAMRIDPLDALRSS
jgi:ABC-type lipoprotein release transport system permease subunit